MTGRLRAETVAVLLLLFTSCVQAAKNMNGEPGQYKISNDNPHSKESYSTDYEAEYFEVYSEKIKTRYSEVHWRMHDPIRLPEHVIERF
jgi:hypothetical protein